MKMTWKNLLLALKDQGPAWRFFKNFVITRNAWGMFHVNSHVAAGSQKPKVMYNAKVTAEKAAASMQRKHGYHYSPYKCVWCDGYHIGRNRSNKQPLEATMKR